MYFGLPDTKKKKMKEEKEGLKISCSISNDGANGFIFNEESEQLESKINFYETGLNLSVQEKKEILEEMIKKTFSIIQLKEEIKNQKSWENRCSAFREAYACESNRCESVLVWLMITILGLSKIEANKRYKLAEELKTHNEFKDKEDSIIERIYLNENNLSQSETLLR